MSEQFRYLFTPLQIGSVSVRNRILMTAHGKGYAENDLPSERMAYYYAERAKGGAGLIITEASIIHPTGRSLFGMVYGFDRRSIPGYKLIADMVHEHGGTLFGQLWHPGANSTGVHTGLPVWSASALPSATFRELPHAIDKYEIKEVIDGFVQTALNFKEAGYDGVEIHGAHGYLLQQFMSPLLNTRTDEYGGSLENRLRLSFQVIDAVRAAVGPDYVVGFKISGDEFVEGGLTLEDMKVIAPLIEGTGKIDYIMVSAGNARTYWAVIPPMDIPLGGFMHLAAGIKQVASLPVFNVGRINDPVLAERALAQGHADMIGMTRALLVDPEMPIKAREGRLEEIRKCVACVQNCRMMMVGKDVSCIQNVAAGREKELGIGTIVPAVQKKKVMIVGGGPGGMEAARVAASRGHRVTLYEKSGQLGGQVNIAAKGPSRLEFGDIVRYLTVQMQVLNIDVRLNTEITVDMVLAEQPDAVVVATGSTPYRAPIPGADESNVLTYWQAINDEAPVGERVIVLDGGDGFWPLCSTAEYLAQKRHNVEVVTPLHFVGADVNILALPFLYKRLRAAKIQLTPETGIKAIDGPKVTLFDVHCGQERTVEADTVVMAVGNVANDHLYHALRDRLKEIYMVGDAMAPRRVDAAIREGNRVGRAL